MIASSSEKHATLVAASSADVVRLESQPIVWDEAIFADLCEAIGIETVHAIAARFHADLHVRFCDPTDCDMLRRDAHAVTSSAGTLGFVTLSDAARALEEACLETGDIDAPLVDLLRAREAAIQHLVGRTNRGAIGP